MIYKILKLLWGQSFADRKFGKKTLLKVIFFQKILRFNSNVYWPVHWTSQIKEPQKIDRGNRCPGLSRFCYLDARNGIIFGQNVWVGPRVSIISMNHDLNNFYKYLKDKPIKIGDNCWIGSSVTILPGVELGNHVVVAAGTIVTKSFMEDNILIGGVPAKVIKNIGSYHGGDEDT